MLCWLAERAAQSPDDIALIFQDRRWTFAELNEQAAEMAAQLASAGIKPGDHVAALLPNRPEYVFLVFALTRMGCVIVPVNTRLTPPEIARLVERAGCRALVCSARTRQAASALAGIQVIDVDTQAHPDPDQVEFWRSGRPISRHAALAIIYTSGTTGIPKGAMLTFDNFLSSAIASRRRLGHETAARWLLCMPLYHVGGLSIVLRCCLYGTTIVLHDGFDVDAVSHALDDEGVTLVSLVPTMLHRLIEQRGARPFPPSLKCILLGGAAASPKLVRQCIDLEIPIATTYGLTETCSQAATATPDEVRAAPDHVGRALPGVRLRILGDDGRERPAGTIGEIVLSGRMVMSGYYQDPVSTAAALRDGWLHTGDLGSLDERGNLRVAQRRSDLIVSGGENVYPAEVEAVLETHSSVREAVVVGVEDAEWGQRVAALVVSSDTRPDAEALIAHCRAQLAGYKCPRIIRFVDALPRTASGKVLRREAARLLEAQLAEPHQAG